MVTHCDARRLSLLGWSSDRSSAKESIDAPANDATDRLDAAVKECRVEKGPRSVLLLSLGRRGSL